MDEIDKLILKTDRTVLRAYKDEDAESVYPVVSSKYIASTTVNIPHPYPEKHVNVWINYIRGCMADGNSYEFGIFSNDDFKTYIGNCSLLGISKEHLNAELGYFINPNFWRKGYATEACKAIISFGFKELGLERIYAKCMHKNEPSRRVLEKCCLTFEGVSRHEVLKWGNFEDVCRYGIIKSEWLKANTMD
jgi:ribosomal-protein-alanine N-acetyltransferase